MIKRLTPAPAALAAAGMLAAGLTGCSSSTNGQGKDAGPTGMTTSGGTTSSTTAGGPTTPAAQLGARLMSGTRSVTSAHLDLHISAAGTSVHGSGDEKVANGRLIAMDLSEGVPNAGPIRIIIVGGRTYAKLPRQANPTGKPYVLVSPRSSNPTVQQLAGAASSALSAGSLKMYASFVQAAKSIKVGNRETVDGTGATHYTVVVDPTKLPTSAALNKQALAASGLKTIPVQLWVDDQGRPVKVTERLRVQGQTLSIVCTISRYNQPVTITAPPANQVSTK